MAGIGKISGLNNNISFSARFWGKRKEADMLYLDSYDVLRYGVPKKVLFVPDEKYRVTWAKLFDEDNKCFHSVDIPDDEVDHYISFFKSKGVKDENIHEFETIKGGQYDKPTKRLKSGESADINTLAPKVQAQIRAALIRMENESAAERIYLKSPVVLNGEKDSRYKMSFGEFLVRTVDTDFDIFPVLDNLNYSTDNAFKSNKIDVVIVAPKGDKLALQTKDGKRAFLDFNTGARQVYDDNTDATGFGAIMLMDKNGPLLRSKEED